MDLDSANFNTQSELLPEVGENQGKAAEQDRVSCLDCVSE